MATYNVLEWQNENGLSGYPFQTEVEPSGFIVDAKFVQFDDFVPILNYAAIDSTKITLSITFDYGTHNNITLYKADFLATEAKRFVRAYSEVDSRYMGIITFGAQTDLVWQNYTGHRLEYNTRFSAETTRSVPSKAAVYTLDSQYGDVIMSHGATDKAIFYNSRTDDKRALVFNAVGGHTVSGDKDGLREINLVPPINNNINLASNDVIKISNLNNASVSIDLVAGSPSKSFSISTLSS